MKARVASGLKEFHNQCQMKNVVDFVNNFLSCDKEVKKN